MSKIAELQAKIVDYEQQIADLAAENAAENAIEMAELNGKCQEARAALVDEAKRVEAENAAIAAAGSVSGERKPATVGEAVLGPRDQFRGIEPGFSTRMPSDAISGLTDPQRYSGDLPAPADAVMGFLDTIPHGTTDGDEHYFQQGDLTNKADAWESGDKAESELSWTPAVANMETIAHHMPIPKLAARRYSQLESAVSGALMLGLRMKERAHAVSGSNTNGIVGIVNQTGILTYVKADGDNIYDAAVRMKSKVRAASGFAPTHVAMTSASASELKTMKGSDGHYLYPEVVQNGMLDGMAIVEDDNLATEDANGLLVYFNGGAEWLTADENEVTVGLVGNQFIRNAYTLLGEGTHSLKVPFPKAFCYCAAI